LASKGVARSSRSFYSEDKKEVGDWIRCAWT
jgi:hypothetical protein